MIGRQSKIQRQLSNADWKELHAKLADRRVKGIEVFRWLRVRGYTVSQTAFYNYCSKLTDRRWPGESMSGEELAALRNRVAGYTGEFDSTRLAMLAAFGDFLAGGAK